MYLDNKGNIEVLKADELMIANMINCLNNPKILSELSPEEEKLLLMVIRNHILHNAKNIINIQEQSMNRVRR